MSFLHDLYDGNTTLILEDEFNGFSNVAWIIAGLVEFTKPPFPNVNEHCENEAAKSCNGVCWFEGFGTATSIPRYPVNYLVLIAGEGFKTLP